MNKQEMLNMMKQLDATLKLTFKLPKVALSKDGEPMPLTLKDVDFFETEILRQFLINVERVVEFKFIAYPEDRTFNDEQKFCPLHYHAIARTRNDKKFIKIAPRKYEAILRNRYSSLSLKFIMPRDPLYVGAIYLDPTTSYEEYCLKQYDPSKRIVTDADYRQKRPLRLPV